MHKYYFLFTSLISCVCLAAGAVRAEEKIKIGVSTPLTGDAATYGVDAKNVLLFANEKLAGGKYELIFEDDKCSGRDSVAAARRFIDVLKVKYVLGFPCSGSLLPTAPLYEKAKVLVVAMGASAVALSQAGDYIFRTWPSDVVAVQVLYEYVAKKHKVLGVLSEETDYAQAFLKSLQDVNASGSLKIENEGYLPSERDFRSLLLKLKSKGVQALLLNSQTEASAAAILRDINAMKWPVPLYNGFLAGSPSFLSLAGNLAEGIIFPDFASAEESYGADSRALKAEFHRKYGKLNSVEMVFSTTFESFRALHLALESGKDARDFLYTTQFKGLFGAWSFDQNGDIQGINPLLNIIRDQKPVRFSE